MGNHHGEGFDMAAARAARGSKVGLERIREAQKEARLVVMAAIVARKEIKQAQVSTANKKTKDPS